MIKLAFVTAHYACNTKVKRHILEMRAAHVDNEYEVWGVHLWIILYDRESIMNVKIIEDCRGVFLRSLIYIFSVLRYIRSAYIILTYDVFILIAIYKYNSSKLRWENNFYFFFSKMGFIEWIYSKWIFYVDN